MARRLRGTGYSQFSVLRRASDLTNKSLSRADPLAAPAVRVALSRGRPLASEQPGSLIRPWADPSFRHLAGIRRAFVFVREFCQGRTRLAVGRLGIGARRVLRLLSVPILRSHLVFGRNFGLKQAPPAYFPENFVFSRQETEFGTRARSSGRSASSPGRCRKAKA